MSFLSFTEAQTEAWDWIRASVEEGLNASESLRLYRQEGGTIRTQDWYRYFRSVRDYSDTWQTIETFAKNETIPERFWLEAPRNFEKPYVAEVELDIRNTETGELLQTHRYIESDYRMSQQEILNYIDELGADYPESETWQNEYVYGYKLYKKGE